MEKSISYGVTRTKLDGTEATEYFDSREEAEDAFEQDKTELDPDTYESIEMVSIDWYGHCGDSLDYYDFGE